MKNNPQWVPHDGAFLSNCVTCVRVWCMVVSMGRGVGDGKIVDGGAISSVVISDMVPSRKDDVGDGEMTSSVVVSSREGIEVMVDLLLKVMLT